MNDNDDSKKSEEIDQKIFGGLAVEKSRCCGAPIILTGGNLRHRICSQCEKPVWETPFKLN